jgi:nitrate/nitrite transporter NarK
MGSVADRVGSKMVFLISFVLMAVSMLWLMVARELWMLYLFAVEINFQ